MIRSLNRLQPWGIFFLRVVLGSAMLYHGFGKLIPPGGLHRSDPLAGVEHFSDFVVHLGMPRWLGYVSVLTEFLGGILLLLGLLTRFTAFLVACDMLVALVTVNIPKGYAASEYTVSLLAMAFLLVLTGSGAASLDRRFGLS